MQVGKCALSQSRQRGPSGGWELVPGLDRTKGGNLERALLHGP